MQVLGQPAGLVHGNAPQDTVSCLRNRARNESAGIVVHGNVQVATDMAVAMETKKTATGMSLLLVRQ